MPFKKAEIILAYTAHTGSGVSETERQDEREGRLDLDWQELVCLSVAAASLHTEIL